MTEPWTPGPWQWDGIFGVDAGKVPIADAAGLADGTTSQSQANARLMAAAPEMAEFLLGIVNADETNTMDDIKHAARALLSRIRGEA